MPKKQNPPNGDNFAMDDEQFKMMLHKMFPNTKNLNKKIMEMDEITKKMDQEEKSKLNDNGDNDETSESE